MKSREFINEARAAIELAERAVSQAQQKFMGMAHAMQKGKRIPGASAELKKVARDMKPKDVKDYAKTPHRGLPKHKSQEAIDQERLKKMARIADRQSLKTQPKQLSEKWGTETPVSPGERGKYRGKTKAELVKAYNSLKSSGPHPKGSEEYGRMRELAFAIRAKSGWGKVE